MHFGSLEIVPVGFIDSNGEKKRWNKGTTETGGEEAFYLGDGLGITLAGLLAGGRFTFENPLVADAGKVLVVRFVLYPGENRKA